MSGKLEKRISYYNSQTGQQQEKVNYFALQFDEDEGYLFASRRSNIRCFLDIPLPEELSYTDKGRIGDLKHYLIKDSQLLLYRGNGNVLKPLDKFNIKRLLNFDTDRQYQRFIKSLKQSKIIKEINMDNTTYFVMNPVYNFKGKRLSIDTYIMFQDELKEHLPDWVVAKFCSQAKELEPNIKIL